ncbi:hypothetical protein EON63_08915 [archaeon]|nr:MAG: hypothetical protein EON63_08915 [archaeon]
MVWYVVWFTFLVDLFIHPFIQYVPVLLVLYYHSSCMCLSLYIVCNDSYWHLFALIPPSHLPLPDPLPPSHHSTHI